MRRTLLIFLLLAYVTTLVVVGRCETIWHEQERSSALALTHAEDHPVLLSPWAVHAHTHESGSDMPDHSHIVHPDASRKAPRPKPADTTIVAPPAYTELPQPAVLPNTASIVVAIVSDHATPPLKPPLAGRTANLRF